MWAHKNYIAKHKVKERKKEQKRKNRKQKKQNKKQIKINKQTLPKRWKNKLTNLGLHNLKSTTCGATESFFLFILLFGLGRIFGVGASQIFLHIFHQHMTTYFTQYDMQGTLNVITYCTTQLLPLILTALIIGNKKKFINLWIKHGYSKRLYLYQNVHWVGFKPWIKWCKVIAKEIKKYWKLIAVLTILVTVIHTAANAIFTLAATPDLAVPESLHLSQLVHQSWFMYPMVIIVGPLFEEIMFRMALPKMFFTIINLVNSGYMVTLKYWAAIILSAMSFAALHEGSNGNWGILASFVIFALLLQWIYHHSHSIILSFLVHSCSNILVILPDMF